MTLQNIFKNVMALEAVLDVSGVAICVEPNTGLMQFSVLKCNGVEKEIVFLELPIDVIHSLSLEDFKLLFDAELFIQNKNPSYLNLH